jgi:hypothetical protein
LFSSKDFIRSYEDGSQLFRATIVGPHRIMRHATGSAHFDDDDRIVLDVYHHTRPDLVPVIVESGHIRSSHRNILGDRTLTNWGYAYVTSLDAITTTEDLAMIAMAEAGVVHYRLDPPIAGHERVVRENIYAQRVFDRSGVVRLAVDAANLVPQYFWRHQGDPASVFIPMIKAGMKANPTYFEVFQPFNYRIGLVTGSNLPLNPSLVEPKALKHHEFVLGGDTANRTSLLAPLNEEGAELWKIEMGAPPNIPQFWFEQENQDLWTPKKVEVQLFDP